jgi:hypothetical protein
MLTTKTNKVLVSFIETKPYYFNSTVKITKSYLYMILSDLIEGETEGFAHYTKEELEHAEKVLNKYLSLFTE